MDKIARMVNGQESFNIKIEDELKSKIDLDEWIEDEPDKREVDSDSWQVAHIKEESLKDITMKEEPLEIADEQTWIKKDSESRFVAGSIGLPADVVDSSTPLHSKPSATPSEQRVPKTRRKGTGGSNNSRKKTLPSRRRRTRPSSLKTSAASPNTNEVLPDGRTTEAYSDRDSRKQVSSAKENEVEVNDLEPLNLKVNPPSAGNKEPKKNGQTDPGNHLTDERIKLAIQKIMFTNPASGQLELNMDSSPDPKPSKTSSAPRLKHLAPFPEEPKLLPAVTKDPALTRSPGMASPLEMEILGPLEELPRMSGYITDNDLVTLNVRELNMRFSDMPKALRLKYKQRRRTLKNRQYAQNCRQKRASHRHEIESLNAILKAEVHRHQAEITRLVTQSRDLRRDNGRLQKDMELMRRENLALKEDWMRLDGREWHPPEGLKSSRESSPSPAEEADEEESEEAVKERGNVFDEAAEELARMDEEEEERLEELEEERMLQEEEEKTQKLQQQQEEEEEAKRKKEEEEEKEKARLLKERLQQEQQLKEQQALLQQQQSLLTQQIRILQLLQLQQQRQLQLMQQSPQALTPESQLPQEQPPPPPLPLQQQLPEQPPPMNQVYSLLTQPLQGSAVALDQEHRPALQGHALQGQPAIAPLPAPLPTVSSQSNMAPLGPFFLIG